MENQVIFFSEKLRKKNLRLLSALVMINALRVKLKSRKYVNVIGFSKHLHN